MFIKRLILLTAGNEAFRKREGGIRRFFGSNLNTSFSYNIEFFFPSAHKPRVEKNKKREKEEDRMGKSLFNHFEIIQEFTIVSLCRKKRRNEMKGKEEEKKRVFPGKKGNLKKLKIPIKQVRFSYFVILCRPERIIA